MWDKIFWHLPICIIICRRVIFPDSSVCCSSIPSSLQLRYFDDIYLIFTTSHKMFVIRTAVIRVRYSVTSMRYSYYSVLVLNLSRKHVTRNNIKHVRACISHAYMVFCTHVHIHVFVYVRIPNYTKYVYVTRQ